MSLKWEADFDSIMLDAVKAGLVAASVETEFAAIEKCPVDTENLRGSITFKPPRKRRETITSKIGTNVDYAAHVEYGTKLTPDGQPFLRPAFDNTPIKEIFGKHFRNYLKRNMKDNLKKVT